MVVDGGGKGIGCGLVVPCHQKGFREGCRKVDVEEKPEGVDIEEDPE